MLLEKISDFTDLKGEIKKSSIILKYDAVSLRSPLLLLSHLKNIYLVNRQRAVVFRQRRSNMR